MTNWFENVIDSHAEEIRGMGCEDEPIIAHSLPTLRNEIHPLFHISRWMKGYGQLTHNQDFYNNMKPALRLASLFLTEHCVLPWWAHTYFGRPVEGRACDFTNSRIVYLRKSSKESSIKGRRATRARLMFGPSVTGNLLATTSDHRGDFPFSNRFHESDYPKLPREYRPGGRKRYRAPEIAMNYAFHRFFSGGHLQADKSACYRIQFMFAVTLIHEIAHAFFIITGRDSKVLRELGNNGEPLWNKNDREAELGFSWETMVLGRICEPTYHRGEVPRSLMSTATYIWPSNDLRKQSEMDQLVSSFQGQRDYVRSTPIDLNIARFPPHEIRGTKFFFSDFERTMNWSYMCITHAIPMRWISNWFQEDFWVAKRREWDQRRIYEPPPLGRTWNMLLIRSGNGVAEMRVVIGGDEDPYLGSVKDTASDMGLYGGG